MQIIKNQYWILNIHLQILKLAISTFYQPPLCAHRQTVVCFFPIKKSLVWLLACCNTCFAALPHLVVQIFSPLSFLPLLGQLLSPSDGSRWPNMKPASLTNQNWLCTAFSLKPHCKVSSMPTLNMFRFAKCTLCTVCTVNIVQTANKKPKVLQVWGVGGAVWWWLKLNIRIEKTDFNLMNRRGREREADNGENQLTMVIVSGVLISCLGS